LTNNSDDDVGIAHGRGESTLLCGNLTLLTLIDRDDRRNVADLNLVLFLFLHVYLRAIEEKDVILKTSVLDLC
jgi:hypothetical protein